VKTLHDSNFNPSSESIFTNDKSGNKIYKLFPWSKGTIIKNAILEKKIVAIEGYKPFLVSYKPPIIIPIIIFSFIIGIVLSFTNIIEMDIKSLIFYITIFLYSVSCILFYAYIYIIIRNRND